MEPGFEPEAEPKRPPKRLVKFPFEARPVSKVPIAPADEPDVCWPNKLIKSGAAAARMALTELAEVFDALAMFFLSVAVNKCDTILAPSSKSTFLKKAERFDEFSPAWSARACVKPFAVDPLVCLAAPFSNAGRAAAKTFVTSAELVSVALLMPETLFALRSVVRIEDASIYCLY